MRENTWQKTADYLENVDGGCVQYVISLRRKRGFYDTKGGQAAGEKIKYNFMKAVEHTRRLSF